MCKPLPSKQSRTRHDARLRVAELEERLAHAETEVRRTSAERDELRAACMGLQVLVVELARVIGAGERVRLENESLRERVGGLETKLEEAQQRLKQTSRNSSQPPSADPPSVKPRPRKKPSGRRRGGQPGRVGVTRKLIDVTAVALEEHRPSSCRGCGGALSGDDPEPHRRQVTELAPIHVVVTEHRCHTLCCSECGVKTKAELPKTVPAGAFGPMLVSFVVTLTGAYGLPKRAAARLLADGFGVDMSVGTISNLEATLGKLLEPAVEEARTYLRSQPALFLDETSWRDALNKAWMWTAATALVATFFIRRTRGGAVAREILGADFRGVVHSDRWSGYRWIDILQRQLCWAHLKRDFRKIAERGGTAEPIGLALEAELAIVFRQWSRVCDGEINRATAQTILGPTRTQIRKLLGSGAACGVSKAAGMCQAILKVEPAMWTFLRVEGVQPTNNTAERTLRPAVIRRKISYGTRSEAGRKFIESMLTVTTSLRCQNRSVLTFVRDTLLATTLGTPRPSLLPQQRLVAAAA